MKFLVFLVLSVYVIVTSGYRLKKEHPIARAYSIRYNGRYGESQSRSSGRQTGNIDPSMTQSIVIQGQEVQLTDTSGTNIIIDYSQNIMLGRRKYDKSCIMLSLKDVPLPPLEAIEFMVNTSSYFGTPLQYPEFNVTLTVKKSKNQNQPELSPLSKELCGDNKVVVLEEKPEKGGLQKADKYGFRPKRDIGWGEVLVIVLVIVLL